MEKTTSIPREINWEKIGLYIAGLTAFMTIMFYIVDMKVSIAKLEVKVENLQEKIK